MNAGNKKFEKSTNKYVVVIAGPTASGKTNLSVRLAREYGSVIISADSRQFYREMQIGTSRPSREEMEGVKHFFSGHLSVKEYYSAGKFELDVLGFLEDRFRSEKIVFMTGGSGLYIDAVCRGIDDSPPLDRSIREKIIKDFEIFGEEKMLSRLKNADPEYYDYVDKSNPKRVMRALEVIEQTGKPFSQIRKNVSKERSFKIIKIGLELPRQELFEKINSRVDKMFENGLVEEARSLYGLRGLECLKTVGYEELFNFFDGKISLEESIRLIKRNTRRYAKRQITWFRKDGEITWFNPQHIPAIENYIRENLI